MKKHFLSAAILLAGIIVLPGKTIAQYNIMSGYNSTYLAIEAAGARQRADAVREGLRANSGDFDRSPAPNDRGRQARSAGAAVKNAVRGTIAFSSTGSFIIPKEVSQKIGKTAKEKREAETGIVKGLQAFEAFLKDGGYPGNDVARASSTLFFSCLYVYSGNQLTPKQKDGVYKAFKNYYETDKYFQSLNDRERQKIYETCGLMWSVVFINAFTAHEKGDAASAKTAKDTAEYVFEQFVGVPINKVRFKANGFEID